MSTPCSDFCFCYCIFHEEALRLSETDTDRIGKPDRTCSECTGRPRRNSTSWMASLVFSPFVSCAICAICICVVCLCHLCLCHLSVYLCNLRRGCACACVQCVQCVQNKNRKQKGTDGQIQKCLRPKSNDARLVWNRLD